MDTECTISFFKNDLVKDRLLNNECPVKGCSIKPKDYLSVPFRRDKRKNMIYKPFCPEHSIRIHSNSGFVYHNGESLESLGITTKRNLMFHSDFYLERILGSGNKMESGRLCYENSEDAVTFNVFTELLRNKASLHKLVEHITNLKINDEVELYLWGGKIDLENNAFIPYKPLGHVRDRLEKDIKRFKTEPDIMLVVPGKVIICIEAKFGSKNPVAEDMLESNGEKPKSKDRLLDRYYKGNTAVEGIFIDPKDMLNPFHEQIFRNIVFCASMAKEANIKEWYVGNLRNQHLMNMRKQSPESRPIKQNIISMLKKPYKGRFTHFTWEDIYEWVVRDNKDLLNLSWYLKNKSLGCGRAFNIF